MNETTFEAIVVNGQIRLPSNIKLPENSKVTVVVPNPAVKPFARIDSPRLAHPDQIADFQLEVREATDAGV